MAELSSGDDRVCMEVPDHRHLTIAKSSVSHAPNNRLSNPHGRHPLERSASGYPGPTNRQARHILGMLLGLPEGGHSQWLHLRHHDCHLWRLPGRRRSRCRLRAQQQTESGSHTAWPTPGPVRGIHLPNARDQPGPPPRPAWNLHDVNDGCALG